MRSPKITGFQDIAIFRQPPLGRLCPRPNWRSAASHAISRWRGPSRVAAWVSRIMYCCGLRVRVKSTVSCNFLYRSALGIH